MALVPDLSQIVIAIDVGLWSRFQGQGTWRIDHRMVGLLAVNQPVKQVQNVRLGRHPGFQRQVYGTQNGVFVVVENQRQDIDHLPITALFAQHVVLQTAEGFWHLSERRTVA